MFKKKWTALYAVLILIVLLILFPVVVQNQYWGRMLILIFLHIILAAGLWIIMTTGQVSFCHAAFMAIGAYTSTIVVMNLGLSFWIALPLAGIVSAAVALLFGLVVLRLKGAYFFLATFAFGEVVRLAFTNIREDIFGGPQGIFAVPPPSPLGPIQFIPGQATSFYYLAFALMLIAIFVMYRLSRSRVVPTFWAIHESDDLAESVGVPLMKNKVIAFCTGCFFAGIAGSFYAHYYMHVSPPSFTVTESISILTWVVIGGMGNWVGPIIGATVITLLGESVRQFGLYDVLISGAITIAIILFMPGGLWSLVSRTRARTISPLKKLRQNVTT